jgi:hypothetical protein
MRAGEVAVSRSDLLPAVEILARCGPAELEKALQGALAGLAKERAPRAQDSLAHQNPAAQQLVRFVDESYSLMVESLSREIKKVLESQVEP